MYKPISQVNETGCCVSPITVLSILLFKYFYHRFASLVMLCFQAVVACLYRDLVPVANALRGIAFSRATTCYGTQDEFLVGSLYYVEIFPWRFSGFQAMSNGDMLSVRNRQSSGFRCADISHHPGAITSLSCTIDLYSAQFINSRKR